MTRLCSLLPLILLFTACSNDPTPPPSREKRPDGSPWQVRYGALGDDPRSLDPQFAYDSVSKAIVEPVYETLLQYNPFKDNPAELEPCHLAEMPVRERHDDGTETYTFRLKEGIFFHDDECFVESEGVGREVVAEDVAYSFKRIADPKVESPISTVMQEYLDGFADAYHTARENGALNYDNSIPGVEVVDRYTFKLHLTKPYPQILYWCAMPFTTPVPREAVEYYNGQEVNGVQRDQFKFHPVGAGPFQLAEWKRGSFLRMVRNDRYHSTYFPESGWKADKDKQLKKLAGHKLPIVDEAVLRIMREAIPMWLLFRQGYMDGAGVSKDVFNTVLTKQRQLSAEFVERGIELYRDPEPVTFYTIFNMDDPLLGQNKKLRQAISMAYDAEKANRIFFNNIFIPAQQLVPPGVFSYDENYHNPYRQMDMAKARKLMEEAGYPGGRDARTGERLKLTLDVIADDPASRQMAEFEKQQIEKLGIDVQVYENQWSAYLQKKDKGAFQIMSGSGWSADYPDPENFYFLFYSKNRAPQGPNDSRYSDPEFDLLFEQMRTMDNGAERLEIAYKLRDLLNEDCPYVLHHHPVYFRLAQPWAKRVTAAVPFTDNGVKYGSLDVVERDYLRRKWNQPLLWPLYLISAAGLGAVLYGIRWNHKHNA